jgi:methylmalonyl-CoA/ethylmalonyl-CoA epimerase
MIPGFELDHIGVAVKSIDSVLPFYKAMGWTDFPKETVPTEKVTVAFIKMKNQANIELLEATSSDSVIHKFIEKRGAGIHHICLRVKNIEKVMADLKSAGVRVIDDKPRPGAHGCQVAFVHPASTGGVLIELSEKVGGHGV